MILVQRRTDHVPAEHSPGLSPHMTRTPLISAVIPCRNEAAGIEECVRSILAQEDVQGDIEVLVADGLSDDGTRAILERIAVGDDRLRVIANNARSTPAGMNAGITSARGVYIAIMGAHNRYAPDYLARCLEVATTTGSDNVGGVVIADPRGYVERAVAAAHHSPFSAGGSRWHAADYDGPAPSVWGGFYRRDVFERIGLFDERLSRNQDAELNLRLTQAGGTIWQSRRIRSWYRPRSSLRGVFAQYRQYGYWTVRVVHKHRGLSLPRRVVPAAFVLTLASSSLASAAMAFSPSAAGTRRRHRLRAMAPLSAVAAPYVAMVAAASAVTARSEGWDLLPVLPPTFACFHIGYGLGFIAGAVDVVSGRRPPETMSRLTR